MAEPGKFPSWEEIGKSALGALYPSIYGEYNNYYYNSKLQDQSYQYSMAQLANQQAFSANQAQIVRDWEKDMASTQYQRMVADMEKAGLNPASLGGTGFVGGNVPGASNPSGASASSFNTRSNNAPDSVLASMLSSAVSGMIAKDRDASRYLADEFRDNARHAHKMEEIREWKSEKALSDMNYKEVYKRGDNPFDEL